MITQAPEYCPHRPPCAGCPRFAAPGISPAAQSTLDTLARSQGLPLVSSVSGATFGFRHRARLAIRGRLNSPKVGLFEFGTHRVVHIPNCSVQHPLINRVAGVVRRALVDAKVTSYSDAAHLGLARYLQVVIERRSQTAQVVLVGNSSTSLPLAACLNLTQERLGAQLHSLWFSPQLERSNRVLGSEFEHRYGPPSVIENFGGMDVYYPPGSFGQSNLKMAERVIECVRTQVPVGASLTEFYAGVGAIGLSIVDRVGELRMNELNPHSLQGLDFGLANLDAAGRRKVSVIAGAAGASCHAADGVHVVIADPPRKGLDPELCDYLAATPPERFIYVSCGLESLLKDTARLTAGGSLRLTELNAFNLFPFTDHVETVARFDRT